MDRARHAYVNRTGLNIGGQEQSKVDRKGSEIKGQNRTRRIYVDRISHRWTEQDQT